MASKEMDIQKRREKTARNKASRRKSSWAETIFPILVFAFTLIFFLNFVGIIDLPFYILCACLQGRREIQKI